MDLRREPDRAWPGGIARRGPRRATALLVLGLLALAVPAHALDRAAAPQPLRGDTIPPVTDAPRTERTWFGPDFWTGIRDAARSVRELEGGFDRYAGRYGVSRELARTITEAAHAEGIDPDLAFRLVRVESRFNPRARGPGGSLGLMQLMPGTARAIDRSVRTEAEILDPQTNARLGLRYLRRMIERYDGDVRLGLLAYNRGPLAVDRALQRKQDPENGYSRKVLGTLANRYQGPGLIEKQPPQR
jgi:soluble lytic murein transglycosylase-like protein